MKISIIENDKRGKKKKRKENDKRGINRQVTKEERSMAFKYMNRY